MTGVNPITRKDGAIMKQNRIRNLFTRMVPAVVFAFALALASRASIAGESAANDDPDLATAIRSTVKPPQKADFSREALLGIFVEAPTPVRQASVGRVDVRFSSVHSPGRRSAPTLLEFLFQALGIHPPLFENDGTYGATAVQIVDPLFITGTNFPYTREAMEEFSERFTRGTEFLTRDEERYRKEMIALVMAANRRDSGRTPEHGTAATTMVLEATAPSAFASRREGERE